MSKKNNRRKSKIGRTKNNTTIAGNSRSELLGVKNHFIGRAARDFKKAFGFKRV